MSSAISRAQLAQMFTMAGNCLSEGTILVPTSPVAIPLGQVTQPHWSWFFNLDPTNYVNIGEGSTGAYFCTLYPGEFALVPWNSVGNLPYAVANTAAVLLEYLILSL